MKLTVRALTVASLLLWMSVLPLPAQSTENLEPQVGPNSWFNLPGTIFVVERNGQLLGYFAEVSGIGSEHDVVEFVDGGDPNIVRKIPGRLHYLDVTLKRGITRDTSAWDWRQQVVDGDIQGARSALTIKLLRGAGTPVAVWQFGNAWPSKITGPQPRSSPGEIPVEELVIVHEGMVRSQ